MKRAPEICPVCKGRCCLDELYYSVEHMGAGWYRHDCPGCDDGTKPIPPRTSEDERADVLAWLHDRVAKSYGVGTIPGTFGYNDRAIAEAFERGEHVGAAKRVKP